MAQETKTAMMRAANNLRKHAPGEWADFIAAFDDFVNDELVRCLRGPPGEAMLGLGWARSLVQLRADFRASKDVE